MNSTSCSYTLYYYPSLLKVQQKYSVVQYSYLMYECTIKLKKLNFNVFVYVYAII